MKTMKELTYYSYLLVILTTTSLISAILVDTKYGEIVGKIFVEKSMKVTEFLGIPYAEPPIGELRFRQPKPVRPWKHVLEATKQPPACIQNSSIPFPWVDHEPGKSEDCLYLNIFVPDLDCKKDKEKRAVIFWIHGGESIFGSNRMDLYNARALAAVGDVIVVTTNYRLGILGYLSTHLKEAPGNVAMYDILLSLKWVKENIDSFGGNPDVITIAGESSGALFSTYSFTSPLFDGLYSRAILQSGALKDTDIFDLESSREFSNQVATEAGCANEILTLQNNPKKVLNCLRCIDAWKLLFATDTALKKAGMLYTIPQYGDEIFPVKLRNALISGKFRNHDILVGCTKDEGTIGVVISSPEMFGYFGEKPFNVTKNFAISFLSQGFRQLPEYRRIIDYYLSDLNERNYYAIRANMTLAAGEIMFFCPAVYVAERFSDRGNNVYFYVFNHRSSRSPFAPWMKDTHFEDVEFVFGKPVRFPRKYRDEEVRFSWEIMTMWTNFAKYGKPDTNFVSWPTYNRNEDVYLNLNPKGYDIGKGVHRVNCNFWRRYLL